MTSSPVVPAASANDDSRARILRDLATGRRHFNLDQLVRELTAGQCDKPADAPPPRPGSICHCCCRLINAKKDRIALLNGVVTHEGCR